MKPLLKILQSLAKLPIAMSLFYAEKLSKALKKQAGILIWLLVLIVVAALSLVAWWPRVFPAKERPPSIGEALSPTVVVVNSDQAERINTPEPSTTKPQMPSAQHTNLHNQADATTNAHPAYGVDILPTHDDITVIAAQLALSPDASDIQITSFQGKPAVRFQTKHGEAYAVRDEGFIHYIF